MGKAVGKRGGLMYSGPSKTVEAIVAVFVPPACREEVLGDLHERYRSPRQYTLDALRTVPLVIISRIRRTADPQILVMQAFVLYVSFLGAAWLRDRALLGEQWGLLRLAIPAAMMILGLILDDTYANPGRRSALNPARGPVLGLIFVLTSQEMFQISNPDLALPRWITFYGCAMSFLLSSAVRMWFPPVTDQLQGANAPAHWLKQAGGSSENPQGDIRVLKAVFVIVTVAIVGTWMFMRAAPPRTQIVPILLVLLVAYQVWKRA
jgi:hypothetical protein